MTTVTRIEEQAAPAQSGSVSEVTSIVKLIERVVTNPEIDIEKIERLLEMQERMEAKAAKQAYDAALSAMRPHLPIIDERGSIKNNSGAVQSTYATWDDIVERITPILSDHGFALSFKPLTVGDRPGVQGTLSHSAGHRESAELALPVDTGPGRNAVQSVGSTLSYAQRYVAKLLLNLASRKSDDDDGQRAGLSAAVQAAIAAINLCQDLKGLRDWKEKNEEALKAMAPDDADRIVRVFNGRHRKLKSEEAAR